MKMSRSISEALPSPGLSQSQSRTSTPVPQTNRRSIQREAADIANPTVEQSQNNWKSKRRIISACLMSFGNGVNDSTPGAVIPYMETGYKIGYAVVSLIFVANAVGFILAAPVTHVLERKISHSKSYAAAMSCLVIGYAIVVSEPPFPVVVITFLLYGFGLAVNLALTNAFCATLPNATVSLGYLHGAYGIGGTVAPIMATSMASNGISWSLFYTIPLAIAVLNMTLALWAFSHSEEEKPSESERTLFQSASGAMSRTQVLKKAIQNRTTLLGALFIFVYQGAEVSVSGWLVSFLISYRHGDPSRVGYVSAGFWAGITVGRLFLTYPATKLGEKTSVVLMILGAILFQLLIWLIPNLIGEFYI
ncbi:hypothetical protein N7457_006193 [Penicillium paradoxum]|uniref:uncharacterized protein n=1 Tax=Penicillium paradoxum TaxID=176176 RepID=UPI0025498C90|nr:uncharacterized protein N7457_006193 [Penicillium paradoxum]KAJ5781033.1 hypothetical protein N7457_006193 [Penicillium paradoxum]